MRRKSPWARPSISTVGGCRTHAEFSVTDERRTNDSLCQLADGARVDRALCRSSQGNMCTLLRGSKDARSAITKKDTDAYAMHLLLIALHTCLEQIIKNANSYVYCKQQHCCSCSSSGGRPPPRRFVVCRFRSRSAGADFFQPRGTDPGPHGPDRCP